MYVLGGAMIDRRRALCTVVLLTGSALGCGTSPDVLDAQLIAAGVPIWLGWLAIGGLGVLLAARAFFFGLLPTMGVCWLLGRIG